MRIQPGRMVSLGYGRFVRSDDVTAIEPITEGRGPGRRALVWMRGLETPLVASRSEEAIVEDLIRSSEEAQRSRQQRSVLQRVLRSFEAVSATSRRRLRDVDGVDLDELAAEADRVLS